MMLIEHQALLLFLMPALLLAMLLRMIVRQMPIAWFVRLPGVVVHEALHFVIGFINFAGPPRVSFWSRRVGDGRWMLESVTFRNLTWYNATGVCLPPFLCLPLAVWLAN
jgi:hypothetical protein